MMVKDVRCFRCGLNSSHVNRDVVVGALPFSYDSLKKKRKMVVTTHCLKVKFSTPTDEIEVFMIGSARVISLNL